jgi:hypothetical protein
VEVQWNNINKCVLDTLNDLAGKVNRKARKPLITQDMINDIDEQRKWTNVNNVERRRTAED